jgi:hypothetical protein
MSLRKAYEDELKRVEQSQSAVGAARREGVERLRAFYEQITAEGLPDTTVEVSSVTRSC